MVNTEPLSEGDRALLVIAAEHLAGNASRLSDGQGSQYAWLLIQRVLDSHTARMLEALADQHPVSTPEEAIREYAEALRERSDPSADNGDDDFEPLTWMDGDSVLREGRRWLRKNHPEVWDGFVTMCMEAGFAVPGPEWDDEPS